eukprot:scaffold2478_cov270-Pinguiococcus_pyrenoidosus.AAC.4
MLLCLERPSCSQYGRHEVTGDHVIHRVDAARVVPKQRSMRVAIEAPVSLSVTYCKEVQRQARDVSDQPRHPVQLLKAAIAHTQNRPGRGRRRSEDSRRALRDVAKRQQTRRGADSFLHRGIAL